MIVAATSMPATHPRMSQRRLCRTPQTIAGVCLGATSPMCRSSSVNRSSCPFRSASAVGGSVITSVLIMILASSGSAKAVVQWNWQLVGRRERELEPDCEVGPATRRQQRKCPALVLQHPGSNKIPLHLRFVTHSDVVQMAALQETPIDFRVAVNQLQPVAGSKPVRQPSLAAAPLASNPTSQHVSVIGVA